MTENTKFTAQLSFTNTFFTFELISLRSFKSSSFYAISRKLLFAVNLMTSFSRQKPLK